MSSQATTTSQIATEMVSQPQQVDLNINTQGFTGISRQPSTENVVVDERPREKAPGNVFNTLFLFLVIICQ